MADILLVEPNSNLRQSIWLSLTTNLGFSVESTTSPEEAVHLINQLSPKWLIVNNELLTNLVPQHHPPENTIVLTESSVKSKQNAFVAKCGGELALGSQPIPSISVELHQLLQS